MRIHFIAIGGAAMHNLAIALHQKGYKVTGSDDEIFEPSLGRLQKYGLLPLSYGWFPEKIDRSIDVIILGMHARADNPELMQAQKMEMKIFSYPEFLYEQTKNKTRVVIGGSHGKTTVTSMIMHVLKFQNIDFDYMVGAQIEGFDTMVRLNSSSNLAIFEGDEYLSSPIDLRPKFHWYQPQIAVLTGIAWDHINVFPLFENYVEQFEIFAKSIFNRGVFIYFDKDPNLQNISIDQCERITCIAYHDHPAIVRDNQTFLIFNEKEIPLQFFGLHNLQNISAALNVCLQVGISHDQFYEAIRSFKGAARRLEVLVETTYTTVFRDFAHSPSKLKATVEAVKMQFPQRKLVACMELHTFSSLKKEFLPLYDGSMLMADHAIVYYNPETILHKRLEPISPEQVKVAFNQPGLEVYTDSSLMLDHLKSIDWQDKNLLMMSSGTFSGVDMPAFAAEITCER